MIDMAVGASTVSGKVNFTNDPDVGPLCGAGSFSGTRTGDNFQFTFTSSDTDPGCGIVYGTTFSVSGTFSEGSITNGHFTHAATGQQGTFTATQTARHNASFSTNGYAGTVAIDLAVNGSSVTGYMNFTNNPGVPALCGAGSFRGSIDSAGTMVYDFLSNDPDAGCGFDDGLEFAVSATRYDAYTIANGRYTVVDTGQTGTFSTACRTANSAALDSSEAGAFDQVAVADGVCPVDVTPPSGNIVWPYNSTTEPPGGYPVYGSHDKVRIEAVASDNFTGVKRVEFWVRYDGSWHRIKNEDYAPYEADFFIPNTTSQLIEIGIHVVDWAGNVAIDPGGKRIIVHRVSHNNPGIRENWIPAGNRAYLNQRSLFPNGDLKCGASSAAMVLAMNGKIWADYDSVADAANSIYPLTIKDNQVWVYLVTAQMVQRGLPSKYTTSDDSSDNQWCMIKNEIDAGHPVIMLSWKVTRGHFFVIVGYKDTLGDKAGRELIVYDPFGEWVGQPQPYDYHRNVSISDPNPPMPAKDSRNGQWVYYSFDRTRSDWTIVHHDAVDHNACAILMTAASDVPTTPPDLISIEPENLGRYNGADIGTYMRLYLPVLLH